MAQHIDLLAVGRKGGGRPLACDPDTTVIAKALACMHCQAALTDAEHVLHDLYDKVNLPPVRPVVTRVERYVGRCLCCGRVTLAPAPEGLEPGTPFSVNILALATTCASSADVLNGHRPSIWVSDLHSAQQGHADPWQIYLAHQLRDCQYAIEAGDTIFAPRMKTLRLRAVIIARRRTELAENTRRSYQRRLDRDLSAIMGAGSHQSARQAAAKTLRQEPKPLVHLPGTSRHTARQQRQ